jgi:class 3 adenylate cyclase
MDPTALSHLRHELYTPLNHIIGYSEMLLEDAHTGHMRALEPGLRLVHEHAQQVLGLIAQCLGQRGGDPGHADCARLAADAAAPLDAVLAQTQRLDSLARDSGLVDARRDISRIADAGAALRRSILQGLQAIDGAPRQAPGAEPLTTVSSAHAHVGRILVVDDNVGNREMLARRLERESHLVNVTEGGKQALELLRREPIDLVLLDVMMPEMDGYEVLRQMKEDPALNLIPVLMVSALDELDSVVRCIELGAEDYLPKPFEPVLLRARIGACLEKKRLRDREAQHAQELEEWNRTLEQRVAEQVSLLERLGRLKRFFSPQLAELIVAGGAEDPLKTHRRDVTVCFLDLRGFTAFAERVEPEEVMGVLREYHDQMGKLILAHEGTLERFTGDGMMIFFNDPVPVPNPGERAVRMALAMRDCVSELIGSWRRRGYELGLGIGIAQGQATLGAIGFEGRWDYAAIGPVTNLAARLCDEAKAGQILISKRVLASMEGLLRVEPAGEMSLAGFQKPVPAYNVLGIVG